MSHFCRTYVVSLSHLWYDKDNMGGNGINIRDKEINIGGNDVSIGGNDEKIKYSVKSKIYFRPKIWTRMDEKLKIVQKESR